MTADWLLVNNVIAPDRAECRIQTKVSCAKTLSRVTATKIPD